MEWAVVENHQDIIDFKFYKNLNRHSRPQVLHGSNQNPPKTVIAVKTFKAYREDDRVATYQ